MSTISSAFPLPTSYFQLLLSVHFRMTLPTQLTFLRFLLAFLIMGLLVVPGLPAKMAALVCFLAAGLTDWVDGWLARRLRQVSPLGALLDPIADKVLV